MMTEFFRELSFIAVPAELLIYKMLLAIGVKRSTVEANVSYWGVSAKATWVHA